MAKQQDKAIHITDEGGLDTGPTTKKGDKVRIAEVPTGLVVVAVRLYLILVQSPCQFIDLSTNEKCQIHYLHISGDGTAGNKCGHTDETAPSVDREIYFTNPSFR